MRPWHVNETQVVFAEWSVWLRILPRLTFVVDTGCWQCEGWNDGHGYAKMRMSGKTAYVHRIVFWLFSDRMLKKLTLDHSCRNRWCCNPNHLRPMRMKTNLKLRDKRLKNIKKKRLANSPNIGDIHAQTG